MSEQNPYGPPGPQPGGFGPPGYGPVPPQAPGYGSVPPPAPGYAQVPPQGQPGQPWPAPYYPVTPPKKSRRGLWITLAVVVGAIVVATVVLVFTVGQTVSKLGTHKVVLPQTFQGLTSDPTNKLAQTLQSSMDADATSAKELTATVSTVYNGITSDRAVVVYGGYGKIISPATEESAFWSSFEGAASGATFSPRTHPSPGPQGGSLSCEDATTSSETDAVCMWVDNSSLVVMMQTTAGGKAPSLDKAAQDARDLRAVAEVAN
ncbi:hypothetical protein [Kitasatospora sp. LaBMicrA B282]|uniref:hypothetical protein n=1 Tax=Kitasatospora sp. LaBMicrA B282 TaxID=3420949 RepID=UPI003D1228D6